MVVLKRHFGITVVYRLSVRNAGNCRFDAMHNLIYRSQKGLVDSSFVVVMCRFGDWGVLRFCISVDITGNGLYVGIMRKPKHL